MTRSQELAIRSSEIRQRLNAIAALPADEVTDEIRTESDALRTEFATTETQYRAALVAEQEAIDSGRANAGADTADTEARELRALESRASVREYLDSCMGSYRSGGARGIDLRAGPALEFNTHLSLRPDEIPLRLLAPPEVRAETDTDTTARPRRWLDRLFADTAAEFLGIMMESVEAGAATFPVTTSPATVTGAQRGREEAAAAGAWTIGATEFKPTRMGIHFQFAGEDAMRVPGLEDALVRDMRMALRERMDYVVFNGDDGANEDTADIDGLFDLAGLTEKTLSQANKLKWPESLKEFSDLVDGLHAEDISDVRTILSVGMNRLWRQTSANTNRNESIAQVLRSNGLMWKARQGIATTTAAADFAAAVGLARGIEGAGVCPVWQGAELIRDKWTGAASGQVQLTLNAYWNFGLVRASNFARVKLS